MSALLNQKLDEVIPEASLKADGFFMLFKEFDNDCSGLITFDELKRGIRMQLMIDTSLMSDIMLRQLWITLDEDDSGYVEEAELMRFMDREEPTSAIEKRQELMRLNGKAQRALYAKKVEAEIKSAKFVSSIPTATMRELVANAGLTIPEGRSSKSSPPISPRGPRTTCPTSTRGSRGSQSSTRSARMRRACSRTTRCGTRCAARSR